jgi:hypothetical protein
VRWLVEQGGAEVNKESGKTGGCPLYLAALSGYTEASAAYGYICIPINIITCGLSPL